MSSADRTRANSPTRRMRRAERRAQIITAATVAFSRAGGFSATSLDDVAAEAGITKMICYRHFESKTELYEAVISRAAERLHQASVVDGEIGESSVPGMLSWAAEDPEGFRLLFQHTAREPEFSAVIDSLWANMVDSLRPHLAELAHTPAWAEWGAQLATRMTVEAIVAWLDAGSPDPEQASARILRAVEGVYRAIGAE